ncbi:MAG: hypothetical protein IJK23_12770 [Clostridia bacterium]|nr:hypothetical protein [Clostridia bacterium]
MNIVIPTKEHEPFNEDYATFADLLNDFARRLLVLFEAIRKMYAFFDFVPQFPGLGG